MVPSPDLILPWSALTWHALPCLEPGPTSIGLTRPGLAWLDLAWSGLKYVVGRNDPYIIVQIFGMYLDVNLNNIRPWYEASSSRPLPSLFKLCPWGQKWPHPAGHIFYIGLYREHMKNLLV